MKFPREKQDNSSYELIEILDLLKQGDSEVWEYFFRRFSGQLLRVADQRIGTSLRPKVNAEDIVQSSFRSFFARYSKNRLNNSFGSWNELWAFLVQITIRKCHREFRALNRDKRNINRETRSIHTRDGTPGIEPLSREPTGEQVACFNELFDLLCEPLNETQREIAQLKLLGLSNSQIAQKIGRTERTVYRLLTFMRKRLEEIESCHVT